MLEASVASVAIVHLVQKQPLYALSARAPRRAAPRRAAPPRQLTRTASSENSHLRAGQRSLSEERRSESIHVASHRTLRTVREGIRERYSRHRSSLLRLFSSAPKMLFFGVLSALFLTVSAEYCYTDVESACGTNPKSGGLISNCNAKYGAIDTLQADLQAYANANIETSFEFLLMSTHFGNYEANREGFKELYRKLSDKSWEEAIDLIKYIAQRGGKMDLNQLPRSKKPIKDSKVLELTELNSLAKALDSQKQLADEALRIHAQAQHHTKQDAAIAHYIEEHFMESLSERVRQLAGYSNDLKNMLEERDASLSVFQFDEYLQNAL